MNPAVHRSDPASIRPSYRVDPKRRREGESKNFEDELDPQPPPAPSPERRPKAPVSPLWIEDEVGSHVDLEG